MTRTTAKTPRNDGLRHESQEKGLEPLRYRQVGFYPADWERVDAVIVAEARPGFRPNGSRVIRELIMSAVEAYERNAGTATD